MAAWISILKNKGQIEELVKYANNIFKISIVSDLSNTFSLNYMTYQMILAFIVWFGNILRVLSSLLKENICYDILQ